MWRWGKRVNSSLPMLKLGAHDKSCTVMKQSNTVRIDEKINNLLRSVNITPKLTQKLLHRSRLTNSNLVTVTDNFLHTESVSCAAASNPLQLEITYRREDLVRAWFRKVNTTLSLHL